MANYHYVLYPHLNVFQIVASKHILREIKLLVEPSATFPRITGRSYVNHFAK